MMPKFNAEEEEELKRMLDGNNDDEPTYDIFGNDDLLDDDPYSLSNNDQAINKEKVNKDKKKNNQAAPQAPPVLTKKIKDTNNNKPSDSIKASDYQVKPLTQPNSDWRSAYSGSTPAEHRRPPVKSSKPAVDFTDIDYDDFEAAMMEEENAGLGVTYMGPGSGVGTGKVSAPVVMVHSGLKAGAVISGGAWDSLKDSEGEMYSHDKFQEKLIGEGIAVVFADPRRMNEEFKIVVNQFKLIPRSTLRVKLLAINCDDVADMKKFSKKSKDIGSLCTLLIDPTKTFVDSFKCREGKLVSALAIVDLASGKVLKIWYESDWDTIFTKNMVVSEIEAYRKNPDIFMETQIGIR